MLTARSQTARHCLRAALTGAFAYPLFVAAVRMAHTLPLHPTDRALTAALFVVVVATALFCWLLGAYRFLVSCGGVLLVATLLTTSLLLMGG